MENNEQKKEGLDRKKYIEVEIKDGKPVTDGFDERTKEYINMIFNESKKSTECSKEARNYKTLAFLAAFNCLISMALSYADKKLEVWAVVIGVLNAICVCLEQKNYELTKIERSRN